MTQDVATEGTREGTPSSKRRPQRTATTPRSTTTDLDCPYFSMRQDDHAKPLTQRRRKPSCISNRAAGDGTGADGEERPRSGSVGTAGRAQGRQGEGGDHDEGGALGVGKESRASAMEQEAEAASEGANDVSKSSGNSPTLVCGDAAASYASWPTPTVIVSDGPYGVAGFPGDPPTTEGLPAWYEPHVAAWSKHAAGFTTLWFWGTELGWATVHPVLAKHGWEYRTCHVWDKGIAHIAGNANTKTLRKFPVVSEVCVQYVRAVRFNVSGASVPMKVWLRAEWERAGLPLYLTNRACGVKNAATRKYFTQCHLWYYPPVEHFEKFVAYANKHGDHRGRPYFSIDGKRPLTGPEWAAMRAKFYCEVGVTNVWTEPANRGTERIKSEYACVHLNQKPLKLLDRIIRASSDPGDVVWDPFAGLASVGVAAIRTGRKYFGAEILPEYHKLAYRRIADEQNAAATNYTPSRMDALQAV